MPLAAATRRQVGIALIVKARFAPTLVIGWGRAFLESGPALFHMHGAQSH
jgi:hypothetical protein